MSTLDTEAITARQQDILRLTVAHAQQARRDIAALLAEVARLREALTPIARAIELMDAGLSPDELCSDDDRLRVRAGDLRRVRAVLQAVEET